MGVTPVKSEHEITEKNPPACLAIYRYRPPSEKQLTRVLGRHLPARRQLLRSSGLDLGLKAAASKESVRRAGVLGSREQGDGSSEGDGRAGKGEGRWKGLVPGKPFV